MERVYNLRRNDNLTIGNTKYTVSGVLELKQGNYKWKELLLTNDTGKALWLNVEPSIKELMLYRELSSGESPLLRERKYMTSETGKATVLSADHIEGVSPGHTVEFADYYYTDNETEGWSYEKWGKEELYFEGRRILLSDVKSDSTPTTTLTTPTREKYDFNYWKSLSLGQKLKIQGTTYYIAGLANFRQKQFRWIEFKLKANNEIKWLSVEDTGKEVDLSIFTTIPLRQVTFLFGDKKAVYKGQTFDCVDAGDGKVTTSSGSVDYDYNEPFSFREYETTDGQLLSFEKWEDESEVSVGKRIPELDVEILKGEVKKIIQISPSKIIWSIVGVAMALVLIVPEIKSLFALPVYDNLKKNIAFAYVTSVTSNDNSKSKSHIFETSFSPDQVCRQIIKMDPENIESAVTSNEKGAQEILLQSKKETILIYLSEDSTTYVQTNKKQTIEQGYVPYRARHRHRISRFYLSGLNQTRGQNTSDGSLNTSGYDTYISSARQESINARQSRGGGTGFGK